jgi:phospholipid/cholesterol/gamma-HCH transport system substrate-binding protein
MEPESRYTIIGATVLGLIGLVIFSFVWLSGLTNAAEFRYYTIYFERQSLEGLQIGGDVNMRGIKVGQVESFEILRENINRVSVVIQVDGKTPVSTNSVAVIDRNLVTSIADVNLETPGQPGPPLTEVIRGERYPVIAEGTGELDAFAESANSLIVKADEALQNINRVLSTENQELMRDILGGVRQVTSQLDQRLESFDQTAVAFRMAAQDISKSLGSVTRDMAPLTRDARRAMGDMRKALQDISNVATTMQRSTTQLTERASTATDIGLTELRATAGELRTGVDILVRTLDRLQDPRAALLGPGEAQLGPGETQ